MRDSIAALFVAIHRADVATVAENAACREHKNLIQPTLGLTM